jgi:WD40 repeat protein
VGAVAVAPDGSWLASGGGDWMVRIWDPVTARERMILSGHKGAVSAVAVTADGSWLASGGRDGTVRIWDPVTGQKIGLMRVDNTINACASLNVNTLAVGGAAGLYLFEFSN